MLISPPSPSASFEASHSCFFGLRCGRDSMQVPPLLLLLLCPSPQRRKVISRVGEKNKAGGRGGRRKGFLPRENGIFLCASQPAAFLKSSLLKVGWGADCAERDPPPPCRLRRRRRKGGRTKEKRERRKALWGHKVGFIVFDSHFSRGGDGGGKTLPLLLVRRNDTTARNGQSRDSYSTAGVQILR